MRMTRGAKAGTSPEQRHNGYERASAARRPHSLARKEKRPGWEGACGLGPRLYRRCRRVSSAHPLTHTPIYFQPRYPPPLPTSSPFYSPPLLLPLSLPRIGMRTPNRPYPHLPAIPKTIASPTAQRAELRRNAAHARTYEATRNKHPCNRRTACPKRPTTLCSDRRRPHRQNRAMQSRTVPHLALALNSLVQPADAGPRGKG